ncbi:MAG: virulence RhuM family protein [Hoeflea sp.]|uniref:RhuM family protein n=1 Tax=Hoeflea sp. TaxID=1940281 RepID=UPI001DC53034|nr:RhuM family protein [Hoeflea sp.]MBU4529809.1 virulence RhuM family protein [Alphaproteobacteria bacterium]MBU4547170.1 virulence RhuM family protein [Alphaproteobacteria bacterium]MBU4548783.1 virulence RhuM family protein [Alphaproteobacteria bacterium]MBV1722301.1 virulence RhuM family protein [Hoeflea sp.]MBV1762542.1 virulence RhuM family protein [Hoeflea sp.]
MSDDNGPVQVSEDAETGDLFLVYGTDRGLRLDIRYEGDTLWMTQAQIGALFGVDRSVITKHIANVYAEGELEPGPTSAKIAQVRQEGSRHVQRQIEHYNLDMVISVGYRVSSTQATLFRRWATGILVQFARKGFVVDSPRLKQPDNADRIAELREIIRDIRSDEANIYRELRQICAMCQDYDGNAEVAREFFQKTQAKLVYAVTSHTPAEIVASRADSNAANMGLQTWPKDNIRKADVAVSKNYLAEGEIKELNRLTSILLDIFEDQLDLGRLVVMQDAQNLLDRQLLQLGRTVLRTGGQVGASDARRRAEDHYDKFDAQRKLERQQEADEQIAALAREAKGLPKRPR